ncbi:unnamed protein product, partial [Adineta steineri]
MISIPIGRPLDGYDIYVVDEYRQEVIPNQQGEIVIGGVGVFGGYYEREDLSEQVLIDMNGEKCYMTGDFGRIDGETGELIFMGRKDYQIKLRGQRIELGQIEHTIMKFSSLISGCIVMKYTYHEQEHIIAYVETTSTSVNDEELREKCLSTLSSYMIPSMFIILEKFPLSLNGKINRKALPTPDFISFQKLINEDIESMSLMEMRIHHLWCDVLHRKRISTKISFFSLHEFGTAPNIVLCLQRASINEHGQLLTKTITSISNPHYQSWFSLHADHGEASFAQSRIFLDEQIRFQSSNQKTTAIYNLPLLCRLSESTMSIEYLQQILRQITEKHAILRTNIRLDSTTGRLNQYIQPNNIHDWFSFHTSIIDDNSELNIILNDELTNRTYFDFNQGRVFRCHIVRQRSSIINHNDFLSAGDWIIFNFHHIAFDGESEQIFLDDFQQFYNYKQQVQINDEKTTLKYIDYSIHERQIDMTAAKMYWRQIFKDYETIQPMILPVDRKLPSNGIYSGEGLSIEIYLNNEIVKQFIDYASHFNATLYQLCLTIYYIFLYKLIGGQRDIIIGIVQANRYRPELQRIIGMFVNTLPILIHIDPYDTFEQLLSKVKTMIFESQPYSNLPYQYITEQIPMKKLNEYNLLQTMFTLDEYQLNDSCILEPYSIHDLNDNGTHIGIPIKTSAMFDMELSIEYMIKTQTLRMNLTVSNDLFESSTLISMTRRFQYLIEQLFLSTSIVASTTIPSICDLSIILPEEIIQHESIEMFSTFWQETMFGYQWNRLFHLSSEKRTSRTFSASSIFDSDLTKAIINYVSTTNVSLLNLFLTCYYIFLFKLVPNQKDLCIGMYINNLILLRLQLNPNENFNCCLHRVMKLYQKSLQHAHFPYNSILKQFELPSTTLPDIYFNFQTMCDDKQSINTITSISDEEKSHSIDCMPSKFDLYLTVIYDEKMNLLRCQIHGSSDLFNETTLQQISHRFHSLCQQLFSSSFNIHTQPIYELSIILPHEQHLLQRYHTKHNKISNHDSTTIHQLFVQQAIKHPHKTALTLDHLSLTYSQLLHKVQQLSFSLTNHYNIQLGDVICQCVDRSMEMIIGILGIMMSGGIYVPLNPSDSSHRLQSLVHQIKPKLILTHHRTCSSVQELHVPFVDINETMNRNNDITQLCEVLVPSDSISHIIFTSGSTGLPKGVQIRHRNFISYMKTHKINETDIIIQLANCSFDVHLDEILSSLTCGAHLVLLRSGGHLDFDYLTRVISDHHVTFIAPVPSWIDALCQYLRQNSHASQRMKQIQWWFIGGEELFSTTIQQLLPFIHDECHLLNTYGPAEITETATCYEICREEVSQMISIPIGRPLDGYDIYVVDEYRQEVISNQQGEIVIGGVGVFVGYYEREDLSEQVLIDMNGEKCYMTGDFGRIDGETGELIFMGRKDYQIKLRGQRIELSVIESVIIQSSSDIFNCIVIKEESSNDSYLSAYIKLRGEKDKNNIRTELIQICHNHLPSHMIPSKWIFVSEFPLNANGKIDRHQLLHLSETADLQSLSPSLMTLSPLEKKLEDIFLRAFNLKTSPDISKSFGQLGGTSLGAMHALILIRQEIFEQMDIGLLFTNPSIQQLASVLEPLLNNLKSVEEKITNEENFAIRPTSSWLIETLGILLLAWQWLWPFYIANHFNIFFLRILFILLIHLFQYPLFLKILNRPCLSNRNALYSWSYYRLWFLRHQWSLNKYWLGYLFGTRFYNLYLRLCGARINDTAQIYTSEIDAPWLIEMGNFSYIGEEVVLSSISYHDYIYDLHEIHIGSHCSIETRSVLHDRVDMHDGVFIAPLTAVTGRILGMNIDSKISCEYHLSHSIFQFMMVLSMLYIHSFILQWSWTALPYLSVCWFIWSIVGTAVSLLLLRFVVGNVEEKFSHSYNSWSFLRRFWLRQLVIHSFSPCLSSILDGLNCITPSILRWLGATIENNNIEIVDFVPFLSIPSNLLTINSNVTTTSEICFVPYDITINGQCVVNGRIEIDRRSFLGNNCLIRSDVSILEDVLIGSLTRIDSTTIIQKKDILLGVPAQSMPFILSDSDETQEVTNDFQRIAMEFSHFVLLDILDSNWKTSLAMILYSQYAKYIGRLLGGTQWLIIILRQFGAHIGNDVIIDDINSLYDVQLITIDDHVRLSSTCQIQCHTFEQRHLKLRPVKIGSYCIFKAMSFVLPGVEFLGYNYLFPCSLALPHDHFKRHTDWFGSPTRRLI